MAPPRAPAPAPAPSKPRRLGRGLSALLGDPPPAAVSVAVPITAETGVKSVSEHKLSGPPPQGAPPGVPGLSHLAADLIDPSRFQPRRVFDEGTLRGLADSIKASGLMQPVIVRPAPDGRYELVAGERRWRAAQMAGLTKVPAIVRDLPDQQAAQWALVENVQREDLNAMERAWAFRSLAEKFGLTQAQIAERVGLDRVSIANAIRLTELEEPIRDLIEAGKLSGGHGKALLSMPPGPLRIAAAQRAAKEEWSVRHLERAAAESALATAMGGMGAVGGPGLPSRPGAADPASLAARGALEKQLGEHLGTKVSIVTDRSGARGRLTIEFYGLDHFDGLLAKLGFHMK